jgi:hypothetical protein
LLSTEPMMSYFAFGVSFFSANERPEIKTQALLALTCMIGLKKKYCLLWFNLGLENRDCFFFSFSILFLFSFIKPKETTLWIPYKKK